MGVRDFKLGKSSKLSKRKKQTPPLTVWQTKINPQLLLAMDMEEDDDHQEELSDDQKKEIAKWFLINSPAGEIQYVAKDVRTVISDDSVYDLAASEAFPQYNKTHMISLELPNRSGDVVYVSIDL
ncbi:hypothetical protein GIB67_024450 [Kingdonia uniflora]|uniref:F-actin-capping protein subunit alpha n=1 Tax=Kingdonia uniflora TaxID=39325 RepID=A0A7J7P5H6_9MAGN|nr:hypothetical protein GIB67_024450 [Kingdonia uniflora]